MRSRRVPQFSGARALKPVLDANETSGHALDMEHDFRRWLANTVLETAVGSGIKAKQLGDDLLLAFALPPAE